MGSGTTHGYNLQRMSRRVVWLLALSTGCTVANIYYIQPLLADIAREFGLSIARIGAVAMLAQIGTGLGMLFFVPLGDKYERRTLIVLLMLAEAITMALAASARSGLWLAVAAFFIGVWTSCVHVIVPLAAHLAPPKERGRIVGVVLSGLLIGVLLARTFSGIVGDRYGWRAVFWFASALMLLLAVTIRFSLEHSRPELSMKWTTLMRSIGSLARQHPTLREAAMLAMLLFMTFSAMWTTMVFLLRTPPYHYGTTAAGVFGLLGASSAAAAPVVGRMSDRHGPERSILVAILATLAGYVLLLVAGRTLPGFIAAIALVDVGVQSGHVANQSRIYAIAPEARSRLNTFYMVAFFIGGALGSYIGPVGLNVGGWTGFCVVPIVSLLFALAYFVRADRNRRSADDKTMRRSLSG
jgi:predicted MFS family arabinose efflux permease